jgi:hypothetical protein
MGWEVRSEKAEVRRQKAEVNPGNRQRGSIGNSEQKTENGDDKQRAVLRLETI